MSKPGIGQLIAGAGGVLLIASLFMPWVDLQDGRQSGWAFLTVADIFLLIAGLTALGAMVTGGRIGVFRPDVSLNGATDLFGIMATVLLIWLLAFDLPAGAGAEGGLYLALAAAIAIMAGAGDYSMFRRGSSQSRH